MSTQLITNLDEFIALVDKLRVAATEFDELMKKVQGFKLQFQST